MTAGRHVRGMMDDVHLPAGTGAEQIMSMPVFATPRRWSEKEFYAARDNAPANERWELVDGDVLVTPSPHWSHQGIVGELYAQLRAYVRANELGTAFVAPLDVRLEPGLVLQPDILIVPAGHLKQHDDVVSQLLLACETISPSSARFDRVVKRPRYQRHSVGEYWIVDGESETIERWQPADERPAILADEFIWHPRGASTTRRFLRRGISRAAST